MRTKVHRGRSYEACWTVEAPDVYRGMFDVDNTGPMKTDGVINEKTSETFSTLEAAEEAADMAAQRWIESHTDQA